MKQKKDAELVKRELKDKKTSTVKSLLALAKKRCCNYFPDGCLVLDYKPCSLEKGENCEWFERAIISQGQCKAKHP